MKKKILAGMLAAAVTGMLLSGCGKKSEVQPGLGKEALQEETGNEALQEETGNEALQEETGKEALQEETENEAGLKEETDWFSEKGLAVTPQGDFAFTYSVHGTENYQSMSWPGDFAIRGKKVQPGV